MQTVDAVTILEQLTSDEDAENSRDSDVVEIAALLHAFEVRLDDPEYTVSDREPAAVYELLAELRRHADQVEQKLIRHLKWGGEGMTWEEVATAIEGEFGGRQAMQKRWSRLIDQRRRTPGDMRRGAAVPRRGAADPLSDVQVRAAELEAAIESAPDEATARQLADELHTLMDGVSNVRVLGGTAERRTVPGVDTTTPAAEGSAVEVEPWFEHDE